MTECEKCIEAQDRRDPFNAGLRRKLRAYYALMPPQEPLWKIPEGYEMVCIDCPACGRHCLVNEGAEWCWTCQWQLGQVEQHVGPPVESGFKVGDVVKSKTLTMGKVWYIDPSGFVEIKTGEWTMRFEPAELRRVKPHQSYAGDLCLGIEPLKSSEYPPFTDMFKEWDE